jgi:hypothetical protein
MQVSAEIKLGTRSVLEYLFSPVTKAFHEAGRNAEGCGRWAFEHGVAVTYFRARSSVLG